MRFRVNWTPFAASVPAHMHLHMRHVHPSGLAGHGGPCRWSSPFRISSAALDSEWQEVVDSATGAPYYWNTSTNETTWTRPDDITSSPTVAAAGQVAKEREQETAGDAGCMPKQAVLDSLKEAYRIDTSGGMHFWEVARSHRRDGVFEEDFAGFMDDAIAAAPDREAREMLQKLQAKLSNPLLKQPAPFEF